MDSVKIGKYIAYKRKQKGMTQQELADILMMTNKAISKWETGGGIPDVSILKDLAKALDVTVDELLDGQDNEEHVIREEKTYQMFHVDKSLYKQFMNNLYYQKRIILMIVLICGSLLITGGYAIYSINKYIGRYMDIIGFIISGLGLILILLPILFKKVKYASFQEFDARYTYDEYGIVYSGVHGESKYFYTDIHQVVLGDSFTILRVGRNLLFIDTQDYTSIEPYMQCTQNHIVESYDKYKWSIMIILSICMTQLGCIEIGYQFILKRLGFEYIFNAFEATVIMMIIIFIALMFMINKVKMNKKYILILMISSISVIGLTFIISDMLSNHKTIYSFSPNLSSQLVMKQNKETGKLQDYHYTFLCFGKKSNEMSANRDLDIETKWITSDCNLVTYYDIDGQQKVYVATYGDRGNGISYYNVVGSMRGNWQTYNRGDNLYEVTVENGTVTVEEDGKETVFSPQEVEQNGTIAITLYKGSKAKYIIVINEGSTLDENYLINKDGHMTIISVENKIPIELFCTTYKEDSQVQADIDSEMREQAVHLVEKMQQIIKDDPTLKSYESTQSIFKVKSNSDDYFEVAKEAYLAEQRLYTDSSFTEEGQIEKITVHAGSIQDFFVGLEVGIEIENKSTGESEKSGLIPDYRIMKAEDGYLVARITYRVPGDVGLASLSTPLEKDVSKDNHYHYTK